MNYFKIVGWGLVNYLARFMVGGILMMGVKLNPEGFLFGFLLTLVALGTAYLLLRFVIRPKSIKEALTVAAIWVVMALIFDILTAEPVVNVPVGYLLSELQTWARLIVILLVAPFAVSPSAKVNA